MFNFTRREQLGALVLAGLLVAGLLLRFLLLPRSGGGVIIEPAAERGAQQETSREIVVHVTGAVKEPGIYRLAEGARVFAAIEAAGGAAADADIEALNLAAPLFDGQQVRVPRPEEGENGTARGDGRVNINTAAASELEKLPGIGPVRAAAIVEYRNRNGLFRSLEDLTGVTGIGPKTLESLREFITLY
ncbi:MAG: ComEA family DNA-binding protein [Dethiobacter sp.]|nr:ComEA family DNA-binding protein [Dethiobacter sp.]